MAVVYEPNLANMTLASDILKNGGLVSFPTETVYGLGASAYNANAIASIYKMKKRPRTDPLIVHAVNQSQAHTLLCLDQSESEVFRCLADAFWPGPFTFVGRALPGLVHTSCMSQGDYLGVRVPNNAVALQLLAACGLPIAAPSANVFGHVSPTSAVHVASEFQSEDLFILDGGHCAVGIESTVVKLTRSGHGGLCLSVLREGFVTLEQIRMCLSAHEVEYLVERVEITDSSGGAIASPGQRLTHYAPRQPCYVISHAARSNARSDIDMSKVVCLDFHGQFSSMKLNFLSVIELSVSGSEVDASKNLYASLREAEQISGCVCILLPDLSGQNSGVFVALRDRIRRASSGVVLCDFNFPADFVET